ncbi:uncharacterized protein PRCAT00002189001 [Priceomyces carsonii]|uniref:uncharacterized protein n=1 Tax=Priceomyces carsonii TaxID=28549 RepID=UPI002ED77F74|nr:unnamed protein product [Priceomyces carsonii]
MSNIQVVVRCRGRNSREIAAKSPVVIDLPDEMYSNTDSYISIRPSSPNAISDLQNSRTYKVDKVYGWQADQSLIFQQVALPLFQEFMSGYNVTILAYGQTGTGKTFTMCGDYLDELSEDTGIIPRVLKQLFATLEKDDGNDYLVKCSFIELYNEELKDLLSDDERAKLRIFESKQKSSNSILIQNLKEEIVLNLNHGFNILKKGVMKRKTASTKLNDVSSRSHTIFSINLYRKKDNEIFKVSKMNLVDLAGSENITKSGAINQRAKEAGSINQSLLTLGRVINSLSEKNVSSNHIPYRESKLTRLLQDSIGGETKTTLIATVSPAKINIDETASTLDYAAKAKNIKNLPQSGQDSDLIMKRVIVKDLAREIVKLNYDIEATRSKNGIYLHESNYANLISENESMKAELKETNSKIRALLSKVDMLETKRRDYELGEKSSKQNLMEAQIKIKNLESNTCNLNQKIVDRDSRVAELEKKLTRLNERYKVTTNHLTQLVNENLNVSVKKIENLIRNYNSSDIHEEIEKMSNAVCEDLDRLRSSIIDQIKNVTSTINETVHDIPLQAGSLTNGVEAISTDFVNSQKKLKQNLSDLRVADAKLSGYIKEDHLTAERQAKLTDEIINGKLNDGISQVHRQLNDKLEDLLNQARSSYSGLLESSISEVSNRLLGNERKEIQKRQLNWSTESKKIHDGIDKDVDLSLNNFDEARARHKTEISKTFDKLSHLLSGNISRNLENVTNIMGTATEDVMKKRSESFDCINQNIENKDRRINEDLESVNKELISIHDFNTEALNQSPQHSSPVRRSPLKSPIRANVTKRQSPAKSLNIMLKSKIPQLGKLSHEDQENLAGASLKRRKILQLVDTNNICQ